MLTDCSVSQKEVVAIVLEDVASGLTTTCHNADRSSRDGGDKRITKSFF